MKSVFKFQSAAASAASEIRSEQLEKSVRMARKWVPHDPSLAQLEYLRCDALEVFFGGAAGGGKTDAAVFDLTRFVHVPGASLGMFRISKAQMLMPDAVLAKCHRWFSDGVDSGRCRWDAESNTYFFKTAGEDSTLHFGYMDQNSENRYQSSRFQRIFVDELPQWEEGPYRFLFSRLMKKPGIDVPLRIGSSGNPEGSKAKSKGHKWVRDRFIDHAINPITGRSPRTDIMRAGETGEPLGYPRIYVSPPSTDEIAFATSIGKKPEGSRFIPSLLSDNPGADLNETLSAMQRLTPERREELIRGNWWAEPESVYFSASSFEIVDSIPEFQKFRSWDLAATEKKQGKKPDFTVGLRGGIFEASKDANAKKVFIIDDVARWQKGPGENEDEIIATSQQDGKRVAKLFEQEPAASGKMMGSHWQRSLFGHQVHLMRKTGEKSLYWIPLSQHARHTKILVLRAPWNAALIDELKYLPGENDDQADAASQLFSFIAGKPDPIRRARAYE